MLLKSALVIGVLLLAKEATALNCYTCVGVDSDQCDKIRVETPCLSGFENCYKFVGSVEDDSLGMKGKVAAKSCAPADMCDTLKNNPLVKIDHCSICKDKDYCNSSSMIQGTPLLVALVFALIYKFLG